MRGPCSWGAVGTRASFSRSCLAASGIPSNLPHTGAARLLCSGWAKRRLCGRREQASKGQIPHKYPGSGEIPIWEWGWLASGREQQTLKKEKKQQVVTSTWVYHTGRVSLSWCHRCAEADLIWVMSGAENVPSPPRPGQAGNPAGSHQGRPFAWARLLPESRGALFGFCTQSFSSTEDAQYRSNGTMATQTWNPSHLPCKPIVQCLPIYLEKEVPLPFQMYQSSNLHLP